MLDNNPARVALVRPSFPGGALEPAPPVIPLLTMIRLTEDIADEVQRRGCGPLETFIFALRLKMWPVFQKLMADYTDALKKLAEGTTAGGRYFRRAGSMTTDAAVAAVCRRYVVLFNAFIALTDQPEETMIFSKCVYDPYQVGGSSNFRPLLLANTAFCVYDKSSPN